MKLHGSELVYQIVIYTLVGLLLLVSVFPLIYVLGVSLTSEAEYYARGKLMIIPFQPTIAAYTKIFTTNANLLNSLLSAFSARLSEPCSACPLRCLWVTARPAGTCPAAGR